MEGAPLALSGQKAEEAKLIKARQEGFQAALQILGGETSAGTAASGTDRGLAADHRGRGERASDPQEPRRHGRRPIREMILRKLSFSSQPMTAAQIAKAIEYLPDRTETALQRMEIAGQVWKEGGRGAIGLAGLTHMNGHAADASNGKPPAPLEA
jgi:hypothetical protein